MQIFRVWPLRNVLVNGKQPEQATSDGQQKALRHAFYFGDIKSAAESLGMHNRLSGYVFVLDKAGRIRWRESGKMLEGQKGDMIDAVGTLLEQTDHAHLKLAGPIRVE